MGEPMLAHTRRGFLARLGAAAIGLTLAAKLPGIGGVPWRGLPNEPESTLTVLGSFFKEGDVFQICGDSRIYRVTGAVGSTVTYRLNA